VTRLGLVLVHFHAADLTRRALDCFRAATSSGCTLDAVVVDNGSDCAERALLGALPARLVTPGGNLGYAGGVNLGVRSLGEHGPDPDVLLLANPDVRPEAGCLAELVAALADGAGVAGPRIFWDRPGGVLLPPTERCGFGHELGRVLAAGGGHAAARARRRWRRHAQRHWLARNPIDSHDLSGALLAVDANAWSRVGPFDEGFRLYFEETDWLMRARRMGVAARHVPAAVAIHDYARSTPKEPRAAAWFAASRDRFRRRWYGRLGTGLLDALSRHVVGAGSRRETRAPIDAWDPADVRWLEIASSALGFPAGGVHLADGWGGAEGSLADALPAIARLRAAEAPLFWRAVDRRGRESSLWPVPAVSTANDGGS
jgi:GT2 family glycosyltransferase